MRFCNEGRHQRPKAKHFELTWFVLQQKKIHGEKQKTHEHTWTI